jgi:hypothetical protein
MGRLSIEAMSLTQRQRTRAQAILREADLRRPSPPFWGFDEQMKRKVENHFCADNEYVASRAWGKTWEETFGPTDCLRPLNEVDRHDASSDGYPLYASVLEEVWPRVLEVAKDCAAVEQARREA